MSESGGFGDPDLWQEFFDNVRIKKKEKDISKEIDNNHGIG